MGQALGIMIGNSLGARDFDKAKRDARHGLYAAFTIGAIVGLIMMTLRGSILSLYNIPTDITSQAKVILTVMLAILPLNCVEFTLFIGILRAGGDTTFCTIVDVGALWLIGLPLALTGAFYVITSYSIHYTKLYDHIADYIFMLGIYPLMGLIVARSFAKPSWMPAIALLAFLFA